MAFHRDTTRQRVAALAAENVFIGTSSWKYPGWCGTLYDQSRYETRGRFIESRFLRNCLTEYAEVFKTVCVDAAYYSFPTLRYLEGLLGGLPGDFQLGLKVTDAITIKKFPNLPRFGVKAGKPNPDYLNADLFCEKFLAPCESIRSQLGVLMFEFSRFWPTDYEHGREFVADLDQFLGRLPDGWPYGVEMRNRGWLRDEYFGCLNQHQVTHVYNSWEAMPSVGEQMKLKGSLTNPHLVTARFLLKPGRKYEEAVKLFKPYDTPKEINEDGRVAGRNLVAEGKAAEKKRKTFIYVNNRFEGNALATIDAMTSEQTEAANEPASLRAGSATGTPSTLF